MGETVLQAQEFYQIHSSARFHGTAALVVYSQSVSRPEVPLDRLTNKSLGASGVLVLRYHPADDIACEDVNHDVERRRTSRARAP
jgi:hypothetical protein